MILNHLCGIKNQDEYFTYMISYNVGYFRKIINLSMQDQNVNFKADIYYKKAKNRNDLFEEARSFIILVRKIVRRKIKC